VVETLFANERGASTPDLVVGVDDLELVNLHQPQVVTRCIRRGVEDYLERNPEGRETDERRRVTLRTKCSFHLLVPMAEAYFFGERAALERAGVAPELDAKLCCADLEAFATDDPLFIPDRPEHLRHPKRYLVNLLRRSNQPQDREASPHGDRRPSTGGFQGREDNRAGPRLYRETHEGVRALESLAWPQLSDDPQTLGFARALFEDLADAFDVPNPLREGALAAATHLVDHRELLLRNI
jgi:hypothetical protein